MDAIDYNEPGDLVNRIKQSLATNYIAAIRNFHPLTAEALVQFAQLLGTPVQKHNTAGKLDPNHQPEYVNKVNFTTNIEREKQLPTQGAAALTMHTARAYSKIKPSYFCMLMVDPGWTNEEPRNNGESMLVRWKDVVKEFYERYPNTAEDDLQLLESTPIAYNPWYITQPPDDKPVLQRLPGNDYVVRAWENIRPTSKQLTGKNDYLQALERFFEVADTCSSMIEYIMEPGFLVVLDNKRVAHGRRGFVSERQGAINPRKMLTIGIH